MSLEEDKIQIFNIFSEFEEGKTLSDQVSFKNKTDSLIFDFLCKNNTGKTRDQICKELGLPRSSVFDSLKRLNLTNLIETDFKIKSKSRKGRPSTIYYLKAVVQGGNR